MPIQSPHADTVTGSGDRDTLLLGSCCTSILTLIPVALYQTGVISGLPDPPFEIFDSDRITMSKAAHPLGVPDALLGLASFGATLTLVLLAKRSPLAKRLLGFKLTLDASAAAFNAGRQVIAFRSLCSWCTGTALAAGVMAYAGCGVIRNAWSMSEDIAQAAVAGYETHPEG